MVVQIPRFQRPNLPCFKTSRKYMKKGSKENSITLARSEFQLNLSNYSQQRWRLYLFLPFLSNTKPRKKDTHGIPSSIAALRCTVLILHLRISFRCGLLTNAVFFPRSPRLRARISLCRCRCSPVVIGT